MNRTLLFIAAGLSIFFLVALPAQAGVLQYCYFNRFLSEPVTGKSVQFEFKACEPANKKLTAEIDWGDGAPQTVERVICGRWRIPHIYYSVGDKTAKITIKETSETCEDKITIGAGTLSSQPTTPPTASGLPPTSNVNNESCDLPPACYVWRDDPRERRCSNNNQQIGLCLFGARNCPLSKIDRCIWSYKGKTAERPGCLSNQGEPFQFFIDWNNLNEKVSLTRVLKDGIKSTAACEFVSSAADVPAEFLNQGSFVRVEGDVGGQLGVKEQLAASGFSTKLNLPLGLTVTVSTGFIILALVLVWVARRL